MVIFNGIGTPTTPFICIRLRVPYTQRYRCGDCFSLFIPRFYHSLSLDKRTGSTLSLYIKLNQLRELGRDIFIVMVITNLQVHGSTAPDSQEFYTADLVEDGRTISGQFSQSNTGDWIVYDQETEDIYPVLSVGDPDKEDISTWRNGDPIQLGVRIEGRL